MMSSFLIDQKPSSQDVRRRDAIDYGGVQAFGSCGVLNLTEEVPNL